MEEIKDWRGTRIEAGDRVVYPVRQYSHLWQVEAEVLGVVEVEHPYKYGVKVPRLQVRRLYEGGDTVSARLPRELLENQRRALVDPGRVTVLDVNSARRNRLAPANPLAV